METTSTTTSAEVPV
jgi:glycylpeptide N-tetradecanoyltransferase